MLSRQRLGALVLFFGGLLTCGCRATWRGGDRGEVLSSPAQDLGALLILVDDQALELNGAATQGTTLSGTILRAWAVPVDSPVAVEHEAEGSPVVLARRFGWTPRPELVGKAFSVAVNRVRYLRVFEPRTGRRVAAGIFGALAAALGTGLLVFGVAIASVACGRPLRVRGRRVITPLATGTEWTASIDLQPVPPGVRLLLAEIWTEEARAEHAAVAAFSKLSLELLALGAPPELVARANRAAIQEVQHARLCFALASAYAGRALAPAPLCGALAGDTTDLLRLARESLLDGCMREGIASEIAHLGAQSARDPQVARVLRVQAAEERQHAALAWSIVEWCVARGGVRIARALDRAIGGARLPRCDDLPEHGRVGRAVMAPRFDELRAEAHERLRALDTRAISAIGEAA